MIFCSGPSEFDLDDLKLSVSGPGRPPTIKTKMLTVVNLTLKHFSTRIALLFLFRTVTSFPPICSLLKSSDAYSNQSESYKPYLPCSVPTNLLTSILSYTVPITMP